MINTIFAYGIFQMILEVLKQTPNSRGILYFFKTKATLSLSHNMFLTTGR
jgi:hypothetical protein